MILRFLLPLWLIVNLSFSQPDNYLDLSEYYRLPLRQEIKKEKQSSLSAKKEEIGSLNSLFSYYGRKYGVASQLLIKIAHCESRFDPRAVNGPYGGIYQFSADTWQISRKAMGLNSDPRLRFDPREAIKTTAYKISREGTGAWPVCGLIAAK